MTTFRTLPHWARGRKLALSVRLPCPSAVIAGLDPAIQDKSANVRWTMDGRSRLVSPRHDNTLRG